MGRPVKSGGGRIYEKKDGITWKILQVQKKKLSLKKKNRNHYVTDGLGVL